MIESTRIVTSQCLWQGAASLTITAKSSFERNQNFNDVWRHRHCHQSLSMMILVIVIVICLHRHCHFFIQHPDHLQTNL